MKIRPTATNVNGKNTMVKVAIAFIDVLSRLVAAAILFASSAISLEDAARACDCAAMLRDFWLSS